MRPVIILLIAFSSLNLGCSGARFHCDLKPVQATSPSAGFVSASEDVSKSHVSNSKFRPTNLVFQGGGVKGIAYVGVLEVLEEENILPGVERVAGTSAGAITATLVALEYEPHEIRNLMLNLEFTKFEDGGLGGIFRVFRRYGYFKGDFFLNWMRCRVEEKTLRKGATFDDLANDPAGRFRELRLYTTDVNTGQTQELSARETPNLEVALAARMSMSIPLFFASVEHLAFGKGMEKERHVFVDGGVLFNYPITVFDDNELNRDTLGFVLMDTDGVSKPKSQSIDGLLSYSRALVEADLNVQVDELRFDRPNLVRTAVIDDLNVGTTEFNLTKAKKLALVASGAKCARQYLADRPANPYETEPYSLPLGLGESIPKANFAHCGWVLGKGSGEP